MSTQHRKKNIEELCKIHEEIRENVIARLDEFRNIWESDDESRLFIELVFCLLTPQSGSHRCWQAVENLLAKDLLFTGGFEEICRELNIVRFKNNKTAYILEARELFRGPEKSIRKQLARCGTPLQMREWIAGTVKGLGYKEASHYLRNIGLGFELAILDRHVLRNMQALGLIDEIPGSISWRRYLDLERTLSEFSRRIDIPMGHLDFIFLYKSTGDFFK